MNEEMQKLIERGSIKWCAKLKGYRWRDGEPYIPFDSEDEEDEEDNS